MKRIKISAVLYLALGMVSVVLFQNCAPAGTSSSSNSSDNSSLSAGQYFEWSSSKAQSSMASYQSLCASNQSASASYTSVASGTNMNAFGVVTGKITHVASMIGAANVILFADPAGARVDSLASFNGNVTLCGIVHLGGINGSVAGNVVVEGTVGAVDGLEGNLIIIGGDFPLSVTNSQGIILVRDVTGRYFGRTYSR